MNRAQAISGLVVAVALSFLVAPAAFAQGPGGGRMGGRGGRWGGDDSPQMEAMRDRFDALRQLDLEPMWAVLSFDAGIDAATLDSLRGPFGDAWKERASVLHDADQSDKVDWDGVKREFSNTHKQLADRIKATLSADQYTAYTRGMDALASLRPQGRTTRGG